MNRPRHKRRTNGFFKRTLGLLLFAALAAHLFLTGCATIERSDQSVHAILEKENALIEKLQAERSQLEVAQAVSENERLAKAEAHLSLALEELASANKVIQSKILKTNQKEVENGAIQRSHD